MAIVFQPLHSSHHATDLFRGLPPSTTSPTFSVPVLEQKPVEHKKTTKIIWRFTIQKSSATDGAAAVIGSAAPPVTAAAEASGCAPATTQENKRKIPSFSFRLSEEAIEHDLKIVSTKLRETKRRKEKPFSVSLSKEEIDEDFKKIAHSKTKKRVKKRSKKVQKTMDRLFPGLYLASITDKSYRTCNR